jgi:arsenite-transporting ATPase
MVLEKLGKKERETKFHFFSGKGGVGKTSMSAATALWFAKKGNKTLIISTDPAHSLSDSFDEKIGGEIKKLGKNLYAVEIDPKKAMEEYKGKFMPEIEKMGALKTLGLDETFDIAGMTPGIDEIASFDKFIHFMSSKEYDIIVFDTAPTGHALRFLSLPDVLDSWLGKMIKIRMKFSGVANLFKKILPFGESDEEASFGTEQLDLMKERIEQAKEVLTDPAKTAYNLVMIPEAMSIYESERSLKTIKEYGIPVKNIIVNQVIPENRHCSFCTAKNHQQKERLKTIKERFKAYDIQTVNLMKNEVHGNKMLEEVAKELHS